MTSRMNKDISHTPSLLFNVPNFLKSSPPCLATPPKLGVNAPATLIEDVIREISRVPRTYSFKFSNIILRDGAVWNREDENEDKTKCHSPS